MAGTMMTLEEIWQIGKLLKGELILVNPACQKKNKKGKTYWSNIEKQLVLEIQIGTYPNNEVDSQVIDISLFLLDNFM